MKLLKVASGKYVNTERITYIDAKNRDQVTIQFQNDVSSAAASASPPPHTPPNPLPGDPLTTKIGLSRR